MLSMSGRRRGRLVLSHKLLLEDLVNFTVSPGSANNGNIVVITPVSSDNVVTTFSVSSSVTLSRPNETQSHFWWIRQI